MRVIFSTCSPAEAEGLVERLLEERLIGCANLVPGVRSHYLWEGEVCRDEEVVLLMETTNECVAAAMQRLRELHSYEVPKIVVLDPAHVDASYLAWLSEVVGR
jgi:periplasmic divalent cation tolerance protein